MESPLKIHNTLTGKSEVFTPINHPYVGLYLCGPTVYGYPHLGHSRGPVIFDVIIRYLIHLGYKVRFVRNITDVGHLLNDADDGEDKIAKKAKLEKLEPMEIAQHFTEAYHEEINKLNVIKPSIEPRASGHIIEQIEMISKIIELGYAYVANGSVYFDVIKYAQKYNYGELSGRVIEDLIAGAGQARRELEGQYEKKNPNDFALWKKASEEHIMQWNSPWSMGFPGWHIECSAMSAKYLGKTFDIHGGGMDLLFPHHESEIAQSTVCHNINPANYWIHHNMVTLNGQKMAKSLNNGILLSELFSGNHHLLEKAYSPITLKFFILQAHYRSTLDFSNDALKASEKGLQRLFNSLELLNKLKISEKSDFDITELKNKIYDALNDDFNTPIAISYIFEAVNIINKINDGYATIDKEELSKLKNLMNTMIFDVLGLKNEQLTNTKQYIDPLIKILLELRNEAKKNKDYKKSDEIRDKLLKAGFEIKDGKDETTYSIIKE
ncbi:MAG: cysteine--tRNA ligase [Bacteroidetes bacterium]|nr:cysteine--tRNA ligase [Bacteroidota bacterium]